ncbi:hypothetical protein BS78_05G018900 [Paspalum vaginatum]|nr:hypothetical protein BS78_05G018900 [Paspalum vaginatum]
MGARGGPHDEPAAGRHARGAEVADCRLVTSASRWSFKNKRRGKGTAICCCSHHASCRQGPITEQQRFPWMESLPQDRERDISIFSVHRGKRKNMTRWCCMAYRKTLLRRINKVSRYY